MKDDTVRELMLQFYRDTVEYQDTVYRVLEGETHLQARVDELKAALDVKKAIIEGLRTDK